MERKKSYVSSMQEGVRLAQEGRFAFIGEAVSLDLAVARYCKLTRAQEVISMRSYSIAAPRGEASASVSITLYCWVKNRKPIPVQSHCTLNQMKP